MYLKRINYLSLSLFFFLFILGCSQSKTAKENIAFDSIKRDSVYKQRLIKIADTLNLKTSKKIKEYLNEEKFSLKGYNLKEHRNDSEIRSAIILLMCKINIYYLEQGYDNVSVQPLGDISRTCYNIIHEYNFIVNKEDVSIPENIKASDVKKVIEADKELLTIRQIANLYYKFPDLEKKINNDRE
jgi:hypothetical protein